jgi:sulfur-carrier protein adenylyltransferase/sulfurtransferase
MGMSFLRGDETIKEMIALAYGMEEGLRGVYAAISGETGDPDVAGLAVRLSEIEDRHMERLFHLYRTLDPDSADRKAFEADIIAGIMEGGYTTEEFLHQNKDAMTTVPDLLNLAMMLEAQALDLYMRYSEKVQNDTARNVFYDLAEEEKDHLARLGRLLDEKI